MSRLVGRWASHASSDYCTGRSLHFDYLVIMTLFFMGPSLDQVRNGPAYIGPSHSKPGHGNDMAQAAGGPAGRVPPRCLARRAESPIYLFNPGPG